MPSNNLYGFPQPLTQVFPAPIISDRAPLTSDFQYPIGQQWIDELAGNAYILVSVAASSADWILTAATSGTIDTLTGDSGGAISPSADNINLLGTANQITTTGTTATITFSVPATFIAPGSIESTTTTSVGTNLDVAGNSLLTGTLGVTGASSLGALTQVGTASINGSGSATTSIGSIAGGNITITGGAATTTAIVGSGGTIHIGADAAANDVVVGSTNTTSSTVIQAGTGGISFLGGQIDSVTAIDNTDSPYAVAGTDFFITVDTSTAAVTVTLPATPVTGRYVIVNDGTGDASSNNITIDGNGNNISSAGTSAATKAIVNDYIALKLYFTGTIWQAI